MGKLASLDRNRASVKLCILTCTEGQWPGRLAELSARSALVETTGRPALGATVALVHPDVGGIVGTVSRHGLDGIAIEFTISAETSAFALAVTAQNMTKPAARTAR
ncbi:hypothetical protein KCG44_08195 [Pacificimonas sp. WHA3]|uniref:Uncharacterized protein n=1 Tax=Pacificimonas pallii TaxID=2827236 RepID=A0ABS6SFR2_9SPHN|nr:hypothetical protein [Pacificimonas pallii]MBV7256766.1 hypothetical protein [Pacificimonas pallii]